MEISAGGQMIEDCGSRAELPLCHVSVHQVEPHTTRQCELLSEMPLVLNVPSKQECFCVVVVNDLFGDGTGLATIRICRKDQRVIVVLYRFTTGIESGAQGVSQSIAVCRVTLDTVVKSSL